MYKKWLKHYGGWMLLGLLLIAAYKLFDQVFYIKDYIFGLLSILKPFVIGGVLAYLLYFPANALQQRLSRNERSAWIRKNSDSLAIFITFVLFIIFVVGAVEFLIPVFRANIIEFSERIPIYSYQLETFFTDLSTKYEIPNLYSYLEEKILLAFDFSKLNPLTLLNHGVGVVSTAFTWLVGVMICPYLLADRKSLLKIFDTVCSLKLSEKDILFIHHYTSKINRIFADFLFGKFLDSIIIGGIAYFIFRCMGLKFEVLLALIVLVTNMIPYFGPFIGGVPVVIITLMTMGISKGIWTAVAIIFLQQLDGLLIGPFILGESVGVSALWIIFAITFFGGTMGFLGMVIGVPLIAVIRMIFEDYVRYVTAKKSMTKRQM